MKRVISTCLTLCLSAALALPASALDYSIDAPGNPDYGDPTSIEVVHTADGGAMKNEDTSPLGLRIDSKRRKKLMAKRLALGHKADDHEEQGWQNGPSM